MTTTKSSFNYLLYVWFFASSNFRSGLCLIFFFSISVFNWMNCKLKYLLVSTLLAICCLPFAIELLSLSRLFSQCGTCDDFFARFSLAYAKLRTPDSSIPSTRIFFPLFLYSQLSYCVRDFWTCVCLCLFACVFMLS